MFSSYSVSWQLKGTVMRRAENNTGLATLQQELDKFNEDRQGNKERKKEGKKTRSQRSSTETLRWLLPQMWVRPKPVLHI